jgi:hypothetical protein
VYHPNKVIISKGRKDSKFENFKLYKGIKIDALKKTEQMGPACNA